VKIKIVILRLMSNDYDWSWLFWAELNPHRGRTRHRDTKLAYRIYSIERRPRLSAAPEWAPHLRSNFF
jgi:hypothetical protein